MADSVLFVGWGTPVRGREQKAQDVFQESVEYWGKLQADGQIESIEVVLLGAHGGDLNGFAILRGEGDKLDAVQRSEEFTRLITRANLIVDSLGVVPGITGEEVAAQLALGRAQLDELT
jgi:hypothetical protein